MAIFEINSSNTDVDIQKLKIEIESAVNIISAKVLSVEPNAVGVKVTIDAPATTSPTQLNNLKTSVIDTHNSLQRKRVLVYDLPDATGSASNKDYVDSVSSDTLDLAKQYTDTEIAKLVNSAPAVLDTLGELSAALGADPNFATTIAGQIGDINSDINALDNRVTDLETDTGDIDSNLTALTNRVSTAENKITSIETELPLKANISSLADVATSGSYTDLINTPNLAPVALSGSYTDLINTPAFATVAISGSYNDLVNKPNLFSGSYNDLIDKPNFSVVALSGSYNDLLNKPALVTTLDDLSDVTVGSTTKGQFLVNNGSVFTNTNTIEPASGATKPVIIKAALSQTANLLEIQNNLTSPIFEINSFGQIYASTGRTSLVIKGASGITNTNLFEVQDSSANTLLAVRHHYTDLAERWVSVATRLGIGSNDRPGAALNIHASSGSSILQITQGATSPSYEGGFRISHDGTATTLKNCTSGSIKFCVNNINTTRVEITNTGLCYLNNGVVANSGATTVVPVITKGAASQTANLFEAQNSAGTVLASIDASGNISSPTITSLQSQISAGASSPTGSVIAFAGTTAPAGWLICDGTAVSRSTYSILFDVICPVVNGVRTYPFGSGDGTSTFNLPDLGSRVPVGKGQTVNTTLGQSDNIAEGSRKLKHSHSVTVAGHYHNTTSGSTLSAAGQTLGATSRGATGTIGGSDGTHTHTTYDPGHHHEQTINANPGTGNGSWPYWSGIRVDYDYDVPPGQYATAYQSGTGTLPSPTNISINTTNSGHGHGYNLNTNIEHTHAASSVTGIIGKLQASGGVDGSADQTATSTETNNNNYLILNYIIKT